MSEKTPDQISGDASAKPVETGPVAPSEAAVSGAMAQAAAVIADSPSAPGTSATPADASAEASKIDAPKVDAPKLGAYTADTPKIDASELSGKIMVMSPSRDHTWSESAGPEMASAAHKSGIFGKRRATALAAVIVLAAIAGALGGALATAGFGRSANDDTKTPGGRALQESILKLETEVAALRAGFEQASKLSVTQANKASDRLDRVEKAQAEPAAKIARLTDTVEKLRAASPAAAVAAAPVAAAAPAAPRDTTASLSAPIGNNTVPGPGTILPPPPKPETARLPTVEGWVLRDVDDGGAVIEGRRGAFEVFAGDNVPGLGRIDAIRRQDGRWVVVTSKGLVVSR